MLETKKNGSLRLNQCPDRRETIKPNKLLNKIFAKFSIMKK